MDSIHLAPGKHNVISVSDMTQGMLTPQFPHARRNDYGNLSVDLYEAGECESFYSMNIGTSVKVLSGLYDARFHTTPPTLVEDIEVVTDMPTEVTISSPGSLMLQSSASGYGSIIDATTLAHVVQLPFGNPSGRYTLQPGTYSVIFRARQANSSKYSIQSTFTIKSGSTLNLNLHD
jgi:hypothetical protein